MSLKKLKDRIKKNEGYCDKPYRDQLGFYTIGYGHLITEKEDSVLAISEALLQYDLTTKEPYVEVEISEQEFEKRDVQLGLSDGIYVEIISGVTEEDAR